jgi:hypothetical protein
MRAQLSIALILLALAASAQGSAPMFDTITYLGYYGFKGGQFNSKESIVSDAEFEDTNNFFAIEGNKDSLDTPEEFITATYFSPVQIQNISYVKKIETELPHNDPKTAGLKLGAMWYKKMVELQFADPSNTQQVANYKLAINTICTRTGVTLDAVKNFYNSGIKDIVSAAVDRSFNTISFMLGGGEGKTYNSVLARNTDGSYTLKYVRPSVANSDKEITASSLDALLAEMGKHPEDFNTACIDTVRNKQDIMPAVVFDDWKLKLAGKPDCLAMIKEIFTNFYLSPTAENFKLITQTIARYMQFQGYNSMFLPAIDSMDETEVALGGTRLMMKVSDEIAGVGMGKLATDPMPAKYSQLFTYASVSP